MSSPSPSSWPPASPSEADKVPLHVSNGKAYVWDPDAIARLRTDYHICGVLSGTLPSIQQQNIFLGPPLVLLPEEVVLLASKRLAVLIDDPTAHIPPPHASADIASWHASRRAEVDREVSSALAEEERKRRDLSGGDAASAKAAAKRAEREAKRAAAAASSAPLPTSDEPTPSPTPPVPNLLPPQPRTTPLAPHTLHIPTSSAALPWHKPPAEAYIHTLEEARERGVWVYPAPDPARGVEQARCDVFRDLWERGYFMGGGIRFGGDFLVYPGDPLRYHSHFTVTVLPSVRGAVRPIDIVALGRLGTAVKKVHLLAAWDPERGEKGEAEYFSLEWAGFGT